MLPGQPGFDKARLASSPAAHEQLAAGVFAESAHDVAAAARFAAERGQQVAAQAARHNALPLGLLPNFESSAASVHRSGLGSASGGRALRTIEANAHAAAAVYLMKRAGATALVVVDDGMSNSPVGFITEGDLAQSAADGNNLNEIRIHELMTTKRRSSTQAASSPVASLTNVARHSCMPEAVDKERVMIPEQPAALSRLGVDGVVGAEDVVRVAG